MPALAANVSKGLETWGVELTSEDSNILESYSITEAKAAGWKIKGVIALNSNGNPYALAIKNGRAGALYLSNPLKEELLGKPLSAKPADKTKQLKALDGKRLDPEQVQLMVVKNDDESIGIMLGRVGTPSEDWF